MKNCAALLGAFALAVASPAFAQRPESRGESRPEAHGQREPNAPGANQVSATAAETRATHPPESERRSNGHVNSVPHVNNDKWYGHDKPNDKRYHLAHPFEHGRFADIGPGHRFRVERFDRDHHRFWFPGGFYFEIAHGIGTPLLTGAGIAAMTLWCTTTRITTAGT